MKIVAAIVAFFVSVYVLGIEESAKALAACSAVASLVTGFLPGASARHPEFGWLFRVLHRLSCVRWRDEFGTWKWPGMAFRMAPFRERDGERAYHGYGDAMDWLTVRGDVMLDWRDQSVEVRNGWMNAAQASASGTYVETHGRPRYAAEPRVATVLRTVLLTDRQYDVLADNLFEEEPEWFAGGTGGVTGLGVVRVLAPNRNPFYAEPSLARPWVRNTYFDARAHNDWRADVQRYRAPDFDDRLEDGAEVTVLLGGHKVKRLAQGARNLPDAPVRAPRAPASVILSGLALFMVVLASCAFLRNASMDMTPGIHARDERDTRPARCNGRSPENRHADGRFWPVLTRRQDGTQRECPPSAACVVTTTDAGTFAACAWPDDAGAELAENADASAVLAENADASAVLADVGADHE